MLILIFLLLYPPQIGIYGIESKAAISLPFNLHCKSIAALFFIPYCRPIWGHFVHFVHIVEHYPACNVQLSKMAIYHVIPEAGDSIRQHV